MDQNQNNKEQLSLFRDDGPKIPNWSVLPVGTKFTATLNYNYDKEGSVQFNNHEIEGRITFEDDDVYLCTNSSVYSDDTPDFETEVECLNFRLGYTNCIRLDVGRLIDMINHEVRITSIELDPDYVCVEYQASVHYISLNDDYDAEIISLKDADGNITLNPEIQVGCQQVPIAAIKAVVKKIVEIERKIKKQNK